MSSQLVSFTAAVEYPTASTTIRHPNQKSTMILVGEVLTLTVFDQKTDTLYVSIFQIFSLWFVPFYDSHVDLVTVLKLSNTNGRYIIKSQEDFYQTNQVVKFFWPLGTHIVSFFQLWAMAMCVIGGYVFAPITWLLQSGSEKKEGKRAQVKAQ